MPSLKDTKRRIGSVKNTQKITRAMKLVSSAKYTRANLNFINAKPYYDAFEGLVQTVLSGSDLNSSLLEKRSKIKKTYLIVLAVDRGLCGPLNSGLFKHVQRFLEEHSQDSEFSLELWGKRAIMFGASRKESITHRYEKVLEKPDYSFAQKAFMRVSDLFLKGELDQVFIAYPSFQSALSQPPVIKELLPLVGMLPQRESKKQQDNTLLCEPSSERMVDPLLSKFGMASLYQILLEASTAEHAARMAAMDSATSNADKVIKDLTLEYNRARQASITKELIEITSGAEALN